MSKCLFLKKCLTCSSRLCFHEMSVLLGNIINDYKEPTISHIHILHHCIVFKDTLIYYVWQQCYMPPLNVNPLTPKCEAKQSRYKHNTKTTFIIRHRQPQIRCSKTMHQLTFSQMSLYTSAMNSVCIQMVISLSSFRMGPAMRVYCLVF